MKITPADEKRTKFNRGNVTRLNERIVHRLNDDEREWNRAA